MNATILQTSSLLFFMRASVQEKTQEVSCFLKLWNSLWPITEKPLKFSILFLSWGFEAERE
jgi:hypothetical protein